MKVLWQMTIWINWLVKFHFIITKMFKQLLFVWNWCCYWNGQYSRQNYWYPMFWVVVHCNKEVKKVRLFVGGQFVHYPSVFPLINKIKWVQTEQNAWIEIISLLISKQSLLLYFISYLTITISGLIMSNHNSVFYTIYQALNWLNV